LAQSMLACRFSAPFAACVVTALFNVLACGA
jgi:hypothetical protein